MFDSKPCDSSKRAIAVGDAMMCSLRQKEKCHKVLWDSIHDSIKCQSRFSKSQQIASTDWRLLIHHHSTYNNMTTTDDLDLYKDGYLSHPPPVYEEHGNEVPAHFEIPRESGFFPAAAVSSQGAVASCCPATLYQMHPMYKDKQLDHPIATGTLVLSDPDDGTASQVALVGECDGITFYLMEEDATTKTSDTEFMLLLPKDCILVDVSGASPESILHLQAVLHARTQFHDETIAPSDNNDDEIGLVYPELLPQDKISRGIYQTSKCMSRMIVRASGKVANGIHAYGEKKKERVTETQGKESESNFHQNGKGYTTSVRYHSTCIDKGQ